MAVVGPVNSIHENYDATEGSDVSEIRDEKDHRGWFITTTAREEDLFLRPVCEGGGRPIGISGRTAEREGGSGGVSTPCTSEWIDEEKCSEGGALVSEDSEVHISWEDERYTF